MLLNLLLINKILYSSHQNWSQHSMAWHCLRNTDLWEQSSHMSYKIPYCLDYIWFCFSVSCITLSYGISNPMYLDWKQVLVHREFETHLMFLNHLYLKNYSPVVTTVIRWASSSLNGVCQDYISTTNKDEDAFLKSSGSHVSVEFLFWEESDSQ